MFDLGQRLARGIKTREQFFIATTMIGCGSPTRFFGSAFFVGEVSAGTPTIDSASPHIVYLVTARHVVAKPLHAGQPLFARVSTFGNDSLEVALPTTGWHHANEVSVIPLPHLRFVPQAGGAAFTVITKEQFFVSTWSSGFKQFEVADPVRMFGLWSGSAEIPQIIVRTGSLALALLEPVQFDSGALRVYLVDGVVTRGMSGGPACITRGGGIAENALIGLIYGFHPLPDDAIDSSSSAEETDEQRVRRAFRADVARINSGLAIIVPVHKIAEALVSAGWTP